MGDRELRSTAIVLANDLYALTGPSGGIVNKAVRYSGAPHITWADARPRRREAVTGLSPPIITATAGRQLRARGLSDFDGCGLGLQQVLGFRTSLGARFARRG
jgi:hypothetical protein